MIVSAVFLLQLKIRKNDERQPAAPAKESALLAAGVCGQKKPTPTRNWIREEMRMRFARCRLPRAYDSTTSASWEYGEWRLELRSMYHSNWLVGRLAGWWLTS